MNPGRKGQLQDVARRTRTNFPVLFAVAMLFASVAAVAQESEEPVLDAGDAKCLKCHARNLKKSLEDGEKLSLHVEPGEFASSVHRNIGCVGCHVAIAGQKHPAKRPIGSEHEFSLEQNQNCKSCHAEKYNQYEGSIHASLVAAGNTAAPLCSDCHSAHAIQPMDLVPSETGLPCKNCHEEIYAAYTQSVHGKARSEGNVIRASHIKAPICADCHEAHEVTAVTASDRLKNTCLTCHEGVELVHAKWLPNAGLHMEVVSCAACHAPLAERGIDLEIYHKQTTGAATQESAGVTNRDQPLPAVDESGKAVDARELLRQVKDSGQKAQTADLAMRGRMKVRNGVEAHQLAIKASAVRDCHTCHQEGSKAFENVRVSISGADGRRQYYEADRDILNSPESVTSLSDFYAIGGTRIKLLDVLLVLGLIGGVAIPVGHMAIGKLLRKGRNAEDPAAAALDHSTRAEAAKEELLYINPLPVRIWHWVNAFGFVLLVLTGIQLRYTDLLQLITFETAVKLHNWVGFVVIANYFIWLGYYLFTDKISNYQAVLDTQAYVRNYFLQLRYYTYGIFKGEHSPHRVHPHDKFNPLQRMTYQLVMLVAVPVQFVTGLMMWDVKGFQRWIDIFGGIRAVATVHVLLFIFFTSFILVHAYMGSLGRKPSTHFKEMFTGYEEPED